MKSWTYSHVHYAIPHATIAYLSKMILAEKGIHIPVVTTLHGTDITLVGKDKSYAPVVEFSINKSDGVTAVSKYLADLTNEYFDVTKKIEVIYNFIDLNQVSKDLIKNTLEKRLLQEEKKYWYTLLTLGK